MKSIIIGILSIVFIFIINGCSRTMEPQFRILNEKLNKVDVAIQTSGGNKFSINDIEPGQTTAYQTASVGTLTVTAVIQNESISFPAEKNSRYTIVISADKPPSFHIDQ